MQIGLALFMICRTEEEEGLEEEEEGWLEEERHQS